MSAEIKSHMYTIKEVSSLTGLPASTLRYYESIGIIAPIERDANSKQRVYSEDNLNMLTSVACLSATGMSISDMRTYLGNNGRGAEGADEQIALLVDQKRHLAAEAKLLKIRQQYVDLKVTYWQAVQSGDDARAKDIGKQARALASLLTAPLETN